MSAMLVKSVNSSTDYIRHGLRPSIRHAYNVIQPDLSSRPGSTNLLVAFNKNKRDSSRGDGGELKIQLEL